MISAFGRWCRTQPLMRLTTSAALLLATAGVAAADPPPQSLTSAEQLAIATAFAPTLVFHPDEQYFPMSSMAPGAPESWNARFAAYQGLSQAEKLARATLAYRVFPRVEGAETEIIVEYWCYYVFNEYTIRGAWLPYKIGDNHPHDLERLYFVLRPLADAWHTDAPPDDAWARSSFEIVRVVANAHNGSIPPNQYATHPGERLVSPVAVLVERGSHAMAADINGDGRFTPGVDSTAHAKALWGIRDNGSTWRGYFQSFMDPRGADAIRLCGPLEASCGGDASCARYTLYPADELQRWFADLELSASDREDLVGRTPWFIRTFGDMRIEELMAPTDLADGRSVDRLLRRRKNTETGFVVGFTTVDHSPTLIVSHRHFWETPWASTPDILVEGVVLLPAERRTIFETTVWASYKTDAITSLLFGYGYFTERHTASPILGAEIRLGRLRVRPNWRFADNGYDTRVTLTF